MTTIAYRDGVLAADTRAWGVDKVPVGNKTKVFRTKNNYLLGVSSAVIGCSRLVREWVEDGMDMKSLPIERNRDKVDFDALLISPKGECILLDGNWMPSDPVKSEFYAIGSGKDFAMAAMVCGQSAVEAVVTASKLDAWTGSEVDSVQR